VRCGSGRALASDPKKWAPLLSGSMLGLGSGSARASLCGVALDVSHYSHAHGTRTFRPARETQSLSVSLVAKTTRRDARSPDDSDSDNDNDNDNDNL
jgi:hypothetical protein